MAEFKNARAWRAVVLLCGIVWLGSAGPSVAGPAGIPYSRAHLDISNEPFGLYVQPVHSGGLLRKWLGVAHKLEDERVQLALCDGDRERCVSEAALKFLRIVDSGRQRDGRARLAEINRAINLAIRPMEDLEQYGEVDVWSSPLVTFNTGAGDCEDYAIAKYVALQMVGIPAARPAHRGRGRRRWERPRRYFGSVGRPLVDPRQPADGDGRGRRCPYLSRPVRDRGIRRDGIFGRAAGCQGAKARQYRHDCGTARFSYLFQVRDRVERLSAFEKANKGGLITPR